MYLISFSLALVLLDSIEGETITAAHQQGVIEMFYRHFWGTLMSPIFLYGVMVITERVICWQKVLLGTSTEFQVPVPELVQM